MSPEQRRGPVSPSEAKELQTEQIPEEVFIVFNGLIAQNLRRGYSRVKQKEVMGQLKERGLEVKDIYDKHWLDVEDSYREAGWEVKYDSPSYGDNDFDPYFEFITPKE